VTNLVAKAPLYDSLPVTDVTHGKLNHQEPTTLTAPLFVIGQAEKKNNHVAEQRRITARPGGADRDGEFVLGGGLLNAQATDDGGAPAEPAFRVEAFPSATTASLSFGRANHSAAQTST
jgi:hypothetical protein